MILLSFFLVCLIFLSAFLASCETSLFSLSPITLKSYSVSDHKGRRLIASLMTTPREVLVSLLMFNILVNILVQNTVANLFDEGSWVFKVVIPLILILIFGEIIPKTLALQKNTKVAPLAAYFVHILMRILRPIRIPLTKITVFISRFIFVFLKKEKGVSLEELRHIIKTSEENGVLLSQESDLIEGAIDLHEAIVKERMRPRTDVLYYDIQDPISQLEHLFVDLEATRVPVCDGDLERLLGILTTKEYFLSQKKIVKGQDLIPILNKPYFVPENTKAWTLLSNLRDRKERLAIVVDEYGSISGIISQEDLIEAVVGEIVDRRDPTNLYTMSGSDVIIASGKLELSEFKEIFGISLKSEENIVTLGGWLIEQLGDIPIAGTKYSTKDFLFYVLSAEPNRVKRIYVRCLKPSSLR